MGLIKIYKQIFLCTLLILIIYLPTTFAQDYYADLKIDVDSYGFVTIDGTTNYPGLLAKNTEIYTSKKQSYWLLNITKEENFIDFVYVLTLPEGSSINYINTSGFKPRYVHIFGIFSFLSVSTFFLLMLITQSII